MADRQEKNRRQNRQGRWDRDRRWEDDDPNRRPDDRMEEWRQGDWPGGMYGPQYGQRRGEQGYSPDAPPYDYDQNRYGREGSYYRERGGAYDIDNDYEMQHPRHYGGGRWGRRENYEDEPGHYELEDFGGRESYYGPRSGYGWQGTRRSEDEFGNDPYNLRGGFGHERFGREPRRGRGWESADPDRPVDTGEDVLDYMENYMQPGPFTGIGPRGYQRSDERIHEEACERLTHHGQLDASDIELRVENAEITLEGMVDSRRAKRMAEETVETVSGVHDVHNHLRIHRPGTSRPDFRYRASSGQGMDRDMVSEGMRVIGSDGQEVGHVKEVRGQNFLVDRSMARDVYVPYSACYRTGGQIVLSVPAAQVDQQGWANP